MNNVEQLAKELYSTYCQSVGGLAFNGDQLPNWESFKSDPNKKKQSEAWVQTASHAVMIFTRRHVFWGAGETDCPSDIKSPNGELHTMRCKICGSTGRMTQFCIPVN